MPASHVTTALCPDCDGSGTQYGPYRGVAGCETKEYRCERCDGTGEIEIDDDLDTNEAAADAAGI